jgi:2-methylisocitrate lyase-like PEP mutase family enzyme
MDVGTARLLERLGFEALATTSPVMRFPPGDQTAASILKRLLLTSLRLLQPQD